MKEKLIDYLKMFMIQSYWEDDNTSEQARAIFTTICLVGGIDADTSECDAILAHLYVKAAMDEILERSDKYTGNGYKTQWRRYYMIKLIV